MYHGISEFHVKTFTEHYCSPYKIQKILEGALILAGNVARFQEACPTCVHRRCRERFFYYLVRVLKHLLNAIHQKPWGYYLSIPFNLFKKYII